MIDEAHGSQSGKHADNLSKTLTRENDANSPSDVEDMIADYQRQLGPQANISYFAFTATPRNVTLERFGTKDSDGLPHPLVFLRGFDTKIGHQTFQRRFP